MGQELEPEATDGEWQAETQRLPAIRYKCVAVRMKNDCEATAIEARA
jgi:hypothetical protein